MEKSNTYIEYSSNNSGGSWWLTDQDWKNLEAAGWDVQWVKDDPYFKDTVKEDGRWLRALATTALRYDTPLNVAIAEFEYITGQSAAYEGCSCCGRPHSFNQYVDGKWTW